jgi:uncharacterized protein YndB with AHSA1/START domain
MPENKNEILTTRTVHHSIEKVFRAFSDPALLKEWWGPKGFTNTFHKFEFRPDGKWEFIMHGPNGVNYKNDVQFVEIDAPRRIVIQRISEPIFKTIMTFEDQHGKTVVTWLAIFKSQDMRDKIATFAIQANVENFDRLEALLAKTNPN